jgi:multisubunit Na+/H+ antiporter MnhC subunit
MQLLRKTRETIAETVSQPVKSATILSLVAVAFAVIAFLLAAIAVNR